MFEGFTQPTKNYFPMPNNWPDISARINNIAELKVVEYVLRHTWGFREFGICKTISVDEFMHGRRKQDGSRMDKGTGLAEQSVRNGLNRAIKDGYLICEVDDSDAGRIKKSYALRMQADGGQVQDLDQVQTLDLSPGTNFRPGGSNPYTSDSQSLDLRVPNFIPRTEKDTIEKHLEKDTIEKQGIAFSSENAPAPINFTEQKKKRDTEPRLPAITKGNTNDSSSHSSSDRSDDRRDVSRDRDVSSLGAQAGERDALAIPTLDAGVAAGRIEQTSPFSSPSRDAAQRTGPDAGVTVASTGAVQASRKRGKKDEPEPKCDTREIQRRINDHRGYALEEKVEIIRERQAIKTWCSLHTIEEYDLVMARLKKDRYWGKDENYYRVGGLILLQQTSRILASPLRAVANGDVRPVDDDYSDFDIYKGNGKEERAKMRELYEIMKANGELIE